MNRRSLSLALLGLLVVVSIIAWAIQRRGHSATFTEIEALQAKLLHDDSLTESQRDAGWRTVKQKWSTLSVGEQRLLKSQHEQEERKQINDYFALDDAEERIAYLDNALDQWESKTREKNQSANDKTTKKDNKKQRGGVRTKGKVHDPEAARIGLRTYLDSSTADERARKRVYYTELKQRWAERHGKSLNK